MAFFKGVLNNAGNMEKQLLGPTYKYYQQVNTPAEMGMSGDGNLGALSKDIAGIINYVNLLVFLFSDLMALSQTTFLNL